jgi:capsular exopolysaccharide synthesis family protein
MSTLNPNETNLNNDEQTGFDFMTLINIVIGKWYWFALSIILCLMLAAVNIYKTPKVYRKQATIQIKESKSNSQSSAFADLAGISGLSVSNVDNEIVVLGSRFLMEDVVKQLGLNITYYDKQFMRNIELYDDTPFRIESPSSVGLMPMTFQITPKDEKTFTFSSTDTTFTAKFDTEVRFPFGSAVVATRPQWLRSHIGKPVLVNISTVEGTALGLLGGFSVATKGKGVSVLLMTEQCSRPEKAADVLNKLVEVYNIAVINDKNLILDNTGDFIAERLDIVRGELGDVDGRIENYKQSTLSINAASEGAMSVSTASNLEEQRSANELQISLLRSLRDYMKRAGSNRDLLPYNLGIDNANLNSQIQTYNENLIRMNRLIEASSERNPVVADLRSSLETLRASIEKTVSDMEGSLELTRRELNNRASRATSRIEASSTHERTLQSITRDQKIKEELYLYLLNKSEENAILKSMTEPAARLLDKAYGSDAPISPQREKIFLLALIVGFMIPAVVFVLKDMLYAKVRGRSDVTKTIKAPIVGEIPSKPKEQQDDYIVVSNGDNSQLTEAFRIMRTNMNFLMQGEGSKVIAFTSTMPGEGKTYMSVNYAMVLALTGKRVCLVGLDLRRPSLQGVFGHKHHKGVSDILSTGNMNLVDEYIMPLEQDKNLFLLPAGTIPPNPAELLMSKNFDALIDKLRSEFDYIIIDNPPVNVVSDAAISNRVADISLYVIRAGHLNRRDLTFVESLYEEKKLKNMAIVITDIDYERIYYSVGYSGYGKGYGTYGSYGKYYKYGKNYYTKPKSQSQQ